MNKIYSRLTVCASVLVSLCYVCFAAATALPPVAPGPSIGNTTSSQIKVSENLARFPLHFEPNRDQTDQKVEYLARGPGYSLFLTQSEVVLTLRQGSADPYKKRVPGSQKGGNVPGSSAVAKSVADPAKIKGTVLRMQFAGSTLNASPKLEGLEPQPGKSHYFIGKDPKKWRTNVPTYGRIRYKAIYPGIDLVLYGNPQQLEYDFVVAPGADPNAIRFSISGAEHIRINEQGDLVLAVAGGELVQKSPQIYQEIRGERKKISGQYSVLKNLDRQAGKSKFNASAHKIGAGAVEPQSTQQNAPTIGFEVAAYDLDQPLLIDPVIVYSTYLGGSGGDTGVDIAVDGAGNVYVTGNTTSADFPTVNALYPDSLGRDVFVSKFNADGSALIYSTYFGGIGNDFGFSIAADDSGNAYVTGTTWSVDFPTVNALYPDFSGGQVDAFVFKLNADGSAPVYSTYLGGSDVDDGSGIAADSAGNAYVTGGTSSSNFPTANALFPDHSWAEDAFVSKINADGSELTYSTYFGGLEGFENGEDIAVDNAGNVYVTGRTGSMDFPILGALYPNLGGGDGYPDPIDAFIFKLNTDGALVYSTYLGGSNADLGRGVAVDDAGNAYVTGDTESVDFPIVNALYPFLEAEWDAFVFKLNADGSAPVYSTYLGGSANDYGFGIAADNTGNAYVTGYTESADFPIVDPLSPAPLGLVDAFIFKLNADGSTPIYSTYFDGSNSDIGYGIAVDNAGNAYVTGMTYFATDFPIVDALFPNYGGSGDGMGDAFVVKIYNVEVEPDILVSPVSHDFGTVSIGLDSPVQSFVITNTGTVELTIGSIMPSGVDPTDFVLTADNCSGQSLIPMATCQFEAVFSPQSAGAKTASLDIPSNDPDTPVLGVPVQGQGVGIPDILVSPVSHDFGTISIGLDSPVQSFVITNTGTVELTIGSIVPYGVDPTDFVLTADNCSGQSLIPTATCQFEAVFSPQSAGAKTASLDIPSNDPDTPVLGVPVQGQGVGIPDILVSPVSHDFGTVSIGLESSAQLFVVTNTGSDYLAIGAVALNGRKAAAFALTADGCSGQSLAPSATCGIEVVYRPQSSGKKKATLDIPSNDLDTPVLGVPVQGLGRK